MFTMDKINQLLDVIAVFSKNGVQPFRVRRGNQAYQVKQVSHQWREKINGRTIIHFQVRLDCGDYWHLAYHSDGPYWYLEDLNFGV